MFNKFKTLREIENLDPKTDYERIVYLVGSYENPWLVRLSLEFALFRTYAVPHTSRILAASGQFEGHGQKRYDDTATMIAALGERGITSDLGQQVIRRMNALHGRWPIENRDFLYVLSQFILQPIYFSERYGWRKPTRREKLANFYFWRDVGQRMNIQDIPETLEAIEHFAHAHEQRYFAYDPACHQIAEATIAVFVSWFPWFLRPFARVGVMAMMDDRLLTAFGYPKPHGLLRWSAHMGLRLLGLSKRFMPPRRQAYTAVDKPTRTYPQGFDITQAGPADAHAEAAD
jgi:hypothetical protein